MTNGHIWIKSLLKGSLPRLIGMIRGLLGAAGAYSARLVWVGFTWVASKSLWEIVLGCTLEVVPWDWGLLLKRLWEIQSHPRVSWGSIGVRTLLGGTI